MEPGDFFSRLQVGAGILLRKSLRTDAVNPTPQIALMEPGDFFSRLQVGAGILLRKSLRTDE
jgi:hypothetical protein